MKKSFRRRPPGIAALPSEPASAQEQAHGPQAGRSRLGAADPRSGLGLDGLAGRATLRQPEAGRGECSGCGASLGGAEDAPAVSDDEVLALFEQFAIDHALSPEEAMVVVTLDLLGPLGLRDFLTEYYENGEAHHVQGH